MLQKLKSVKDNQMLPQIIGLFVGGFIGIIFGGVISAEADKGLLEEKDDEYPEIPEQ